MTRICLVSLLVLLAIVNVSLGVRRKQTYAVKGKLTCPSKRKYATNIRVTLKDKDPGPDDTMAKTKTDKNGFFHMKGSENEMTRIDPELHIYTNCNDGWKPCKRHLILKLPKKYINKGVYDIGTLNLESKMKGEKRSCVH